MPANHRGQNLPIEYFEEKPNGLSIISSNIKTGNCVLILGPLFGLNNNKTEISAEIKKYLLEEDDSLVLDSDFQNLYLVEKMDYYNATMIEEMIGRCYERFETNDKCDESYKQVSRIKFSAIVNFTQDIFLKNAFENEHIDYQFSYFSICKPLTEFEKIKTDPVYKKHPFLYNLFGHYQHKASLIYNYDRFYTFFFSLLGETNVFHDEIVNRLSKARVFLMLGFDLKKWYVPIFITKLCKIGRENTSDRPLVLASLNNTDKGNQPYVNWLTRYPLQLNFIKDSYNFINLLSQNPDILNDPSALGAKPPLLPKDDLTQDEKRSYFDRVADSFSADDLIDLIVELKQVYEDKNNDESTLFMINNKAIIKRSVNQLRSGELEKNTFDININNVRNDLLRYLKFN